MNEFVIMFGIYAIIAVCLAVVAWVYCEVLTDSGMILNPLFIFIDTHLPVWIAKPLMTCVFCFGGQFSLWFYVWFVLHFGLSYNLIHHIFLISATIFTIKMIDKKWTKN